MAVYCGVCGTRLGSASENGGGFKVHKSFLGGPKISDTCEDCASLLMAAVTKAANTIVLRVRAREAKRVLAAEKAAKKSKEKATAKAAVSIRGRADAVLAGYLSAVVTLLRNNHDEQAAARLLRDAAIGEAEVRVAHLTEADEVLLLKTLGR